MTDAPKPFFRELQDRICEAVSALDGGGRFVEDSWVRPEGGGGRSRVMTEGNVFEKAGVGFSEVHGTLPAELAKSMPGDGDSFTATGVSLVFHPRNPFVPTVHMNYRFLTKGAGWWFGGGADLTPYYPFAEDAVHFHRTLKAACDRHPGVADHATMKAECDRYFYLPHRHEARGVGGIFFDYLRGDFDPIFAFVRDAAGSFLDSYMPIAERRKDLPYTDEHRYFQAYRRGRYVEFNLVYDRGTVFGLKTGGRIESILMSLPPVVRYVYDYRPAPGSPEARLTEQFLPPRDWAHTDPTSFEA